MFTIFLAFYIIENVQEKAGNKRIQKDHYLEEIKEIKQDYKLFVNNLTSDSLKANEVMIWFKSFNIKSNDLLEELNDLYSIKINILKPIQIDLRELIDELPDYIENFSKKTNWVLSPDSKNKIFEFQKNKIRIFNEIMLSINNK